jgi:acetyl-CoA carboxylase carboxyl transferase subunit beta
MGSVVGERFVRGVQSSIEQKLPFIVLRQRRRAHAGRADVALQMAKTTAALTQLSTDRLLYISVLTDPTMGGVSASLP